MDGRTNLELDRPRSIGEMLTGALATGLLYFDLVARSRYGPPAPGADMAVMAEATPPVAADGHPLDPNRWSDENRPAGWYVNPNSPNRMRHWVTNGPGTGAWSGRSTKTPGQIQHEWEMRRQAAEAKN